MRSNTNCDGVIHSTGKGTASPSLPTRVALTTRSTLRTSRDSEPSGAGPPLLISKSRQTERASSRSRLETQIFAASARRASTDALAAPPAPSTRASFPLTWNPASSSARLKAGRSVFQPTSAPTRWLMVLTALTTLASGPRPSSSFVTATVWGMVTAAPTTLESARILAMAAGRSRGATVWASQLASMPAGGQPVVDDAGDQGPILLEAGFPLDQGGDRDHLERVDLPLGGLALAGVIPQALEVVQLECDQALGRSRPGHQVGIREEKAFQRGARRQVLQEVVVELSLHRQRCVVAALDHAALVEQFRRLLDRESLGDGDENFVGDGGLHSRQDLDHVEVAAELVGARLDVAVKVLVAGVEVEDRHRVEQRR